MPDLQGRLVSHQAPSGLPYKLNLSHLPTGSYFLRLHSEGKVFVERLEKRG